MSENNFTVPENSTPLDDYSGLIPKWVYNIKDLNRAESMNIFVARKKHLHDKIKHPKIWFYPKELKSLHRDMFGLVWDWAGEYRKNVTSIGVKPIFIPSKLAEFCYEVNSWFQGVSPFSIIEISARVHHRLVFIHPFENGNGRFSRFVADRFLLYFGYTHPNWPMKLNQDNQDRKIYIEALKDADRGDYLPLVQLMEKYGVRLVSGTVK